MAIKGAQAKEEVIKKIFEFFPNAFKYDKEIRIPWTENGEPIQIKLTLTAAKALVEQGKDDTAPAAAQVNTENAVAQIDEEIVQSNVSNIEISVDERENLNRLLRSLGL